MSNYSILKIEKINSPLNFKVRERHNFRQIPVPNADINRQYINKTLVNEGVTDYLQLWKERQYEVNITGGTCNPRKGAVYAYEIILGYTHNAIENEKVEEWAKESIKWLADTFGGEKNVLSAVLHMDEHTPHIHAIVIPIDERKHLCARSYTGGKPKMFKLQLSYAKAMEQFGLERPVMFTKTSNTALKRFYKSINQITNMEAPTILEGELITDYAQRCENWAKDVASKSLDVVNKVSKANKRLMAKQETYNLENKEASHLNNLLIMKYAGNKKRTKKALLQLSDWIDNSPINEVERILSVLEERVEEKNILAKKKSYDLEIIKKELDELDKQQ